MKLLVLGGTRFVGRQFVEAALARKHEVTFFHRGGTKPGLFPAAEELIGDRDHTLPQGRWDAVVDFCGYVPRQVREAARALAVDRYVFISSVSVYADFRVRGITEESPVKRVVRGREVDEDVNDESYGWLKVLCERELDPERSLIVRPGLLVGPHDYTGRFTYWPWKVARGGQALAPGRPDRPVQILDARDLAAWLVKMVERDKTGTFNATGPGRPLTIGALLKDLPHGGRERRVLLLAARRHRRGARPAPWVSAEEPGFYSIDSSKARAEGLTFRPLEETIEDTLAWLDADPDAPRMPREMLQSAAKVGGAHPREDLR